jgi:hypothetical protein
MIAGLGAVPGAAWDIGGRPDAWTVGTQTDGGQIERKSTVECDRQTRCDTAKDRL